MPTFPGNHYKVLDGLVKAAVLFSAYGTDLPDTTQAVIVVCFCNAIHFIPLSNLHISQTVLTVTVLRGSSLPKPTLGCD